jgi:hypothetical protein
MISDLKQDFVLRKNVFGKVWNSLRNNARWLSKVN